MSPASPGGGRLALAAPAKINAGLRIVGRRPDGYHELVSVFLPLDLADAVEVEVEPAPRTHVELRLAGAAAGVPDDASNLAVCAAEAFLAAAERPARVTVALTKRIPAAAGLGGGSSDAGAVLRALHRLLPGALSDAALHALAQGLGADVPFFLDPRPARVSGVGERREPLPDAPRWTLLLAGPGVPLGTAEVYRAYDALAKDPPGPAPDPGPLPDPGAGPEADAAWERALANDLEPAALRLCPPVGRLRRRLVKAGARAVGLSGSGPTLFGVFPDAPAARRAESALGGEPAWLRVAATVESG